MKALVASVIVLLFVGASACSKAGKSKELTALDRAYQAGVLTADEYAAKKAALETQAAAIAALDKGLAAGVLTQDEYASRKAQIDAAVPSLMALEKAKKAGILTSAEYDAKKAALLAANSPNGSEAAAAAAIPAPTMATPLVTPAPVATAAPQAQSDLTPPKPIASPGATPVADDGHTYRMKMAKIVDQYGFQNSTISATILIPADWQSQGATTWNIKDACNTIQTTFRATGPDGRAFEIFPIYAWNWADDPTFLRQAAAQKAQFGSHACDVAPPAGAADYLKQHLAKVRPNAKLVAIEPAPKLLQALQDQARQGEQAAAQYRLQEKIRPDVVKGRITYTLNGQAVEEWMVVATVVTATTAPGFDIRSGRMIPATSYTIRASMLAERAPQGQLDASQKLFDLINSTYKVDPQWEGKVSANALAMQKIELKGVQDRSKIISQNAEDIRKIQQQGYENQQRSQEQMNTQFDQVIRGVQTYQNPNTGEKVELDSSYGHAWMSGAGEYILSDRADFNPNATLQGSWTQLQPSKP